MMESQKFKLPLAARRHPKQRAERALKCSPFQVNLIQAMQRQGVPLKEIAMAKGVEHSYTKRPLSELAAENELMWLIQVGVLRREVDGQGITDRFRLTPLGRQLLEDYQAKGWDYPSWFDRFYNAITRWLRFPL